MTESVAGSIRSLWRYPVKSMLGEEIDRSAVTERGFVGDRAYALVDASDGKVASAKNPRKWPRMYECRAELDETPRRVRIRLPDGVVVAVDDPNAGAVLSRILGREVAIETAASAAPVLEELWLEGGPEGRDVTDERIALGSPAGSFFDYAVIHLVTTATLEHLSELYPQGRFDPRRFRPNALVSVADGQAGFVENGWIGKTLALGDSGGCGDPAHGGAPQPGRRWRGAGAGWGLPGLRRRLRERRRGGDRSTGGHGPAHQLASLGKSGT